jgi:hypothetical protein
MAVIKLGGMLAAARGKMGGLVFSRNGGGDMIRRYVKPVNPNSVSQQAIRNRLTGLIQAWRGLTDAQRLAWNSVKNNFTSKNKVGDVIYLSGQQLFTKFNSNLLAAGEAIVSTPPLNSNEAAITLVSVAASSSAMTLTIDVAAVPVTAAVIVRATDGVSPGITNAGRSKFKQIAANPTFATSTFNAKTAFESVFGLLSGKAGQKVFVEVITIDIASGQVVGASQSSDIIS